MVFEKLVQGHGQSVKGRSLQQQQDAMCLSVHTAVCPSQLGDKSGLGKSQTFTCI